MCLHQNMCIPVWSIGWGTAVIYGWLIPVLHGSHQVFLLIFWNKLLVGVFGTHIYLKVVWCNQLIQWLQFLLVVTLNYCISVFGTVIQCVRPSLALFKPYPTVVLTIVQEFAFGLEIQTLNCKSYHWRFYQNKNKKWLHSRTLHRHQLLIVKTECIPANYGHFRQRFRSLRDCLDRTTMIRSSPRARACKK